MTGWRVQAEAQPLAPGRYVPVLILFPPESLGPPFRRVLLGEYETPHLARLAAIDAFDAMRMN